jgi:GDP-L-fucose synthase
LFDLTISTSLRRTRSPSNDDGRQFDSDKPDGQFKKTADNTKLRKLHPDYKFVEIGEGIKKTVAWFIANRAEART